MKQDPPQHPTHISEELLPSQKNEVLALALDSRIPPQQFKWKVEQSRHWPRLISVLTHAPSSFFFRFDCMVADGAREAVAVFSPGQHSRFDEHWPTSWAAHLPLVELWLRYLKREVDAPDLWAMLARGEIFGGTTFGVADAAAGSPPFSAPEREFLSRRLQALEESFLIALNNHLGASAQLQIEQTKKLIQYVDSRAGTMGRREWFFMTAGAILQHVMATVLPPELCRDLLQAGIHWVQATSMELPRLLQ